MVANSLAVVGDKLDLDVGSASGELGNTDASPRGLGVRHELLVDLTNGVSLDSMVLFRFTTGSLCHSLTRGAYGRTGDPPR